MEGYGYIGRAPVYGGIRKSDIEVYRNGTKIGDYIEGGTVVGKYRNFVLVERCNKTREARLWKDLILGLYKAKELKDR